MASSSTTTPAVRPTAPVLPGQRRANPTLALVLGWLVPGGGHFLQGFFIRGSLLLISVVAMFVLGLAMKGKIYSLGTDDILDKLGFVGQMGLGVLFALAKALDWGAGQLTNTLSDYGTKFMVVAGLLNVISAVDAHSLASGRKAAL